MTQPRPLKIIQPQRCVCHHVGAVTLRFYCKRFVFLDMEKVSFSAFRLRLKWRDQTVAQRHMVNDTPLNLLF